LDWDNEKNEGIFLVKKKYFLHFWVLFGGDVPKSYLSSHKPVEAQEQLSHFCGGLKMAPHVDEWSPLDGAHK